MKKRESLHISWAFFILFLRINIVVGARSNTDWYGYSRDSEVEQPYRDFSEENEIDPASVNRGSAFGYGTAHAGLNGANAMGVGAANSDFKEEAAPPEEDEDEEEEEEEEEDDTDMYDDPEEAPPDPPKPHRLHKKSYRALDPDQGYRQSAPPSVQYPPNQVPGIQGTQNAFVNQVPRALPQPGGGHPNQMYQNPSGMGQDDMTKMGMGNANTLGPGAVNSLGENPNSLMPGPSQIHNLEGSRNYAGLQAAAASANGPGGSRLEMLSNGVNTGLNNNDKEGCDVEGSDTSNPEVSYGNGYEQGEKGMSSIHDGNKVGNAMSLEAKNAGGQMGALSGSNIEATSAGGLTGAASGASLGAKNAQGPAGPASALGLGTANAGGPIGPTSALGLGTAYAGGPTGSSSASGSTNARFFKASFGRRPRRRSSAGGLRRVRKLFRSTPYGWPTNSYYGYNKKTQHNPYPSSHHYDHRYRHGSGYPPKHNSGYPSKYNSGYPSKYNSKYPSKYNSGYNSGKYHGHYHGKKHGKYGKHYGHRSGSYYPKYKSPHYGSSPKIKTYPNSYQSSERTYRELGSEGENTEEFRDGDIYPDESPYRTDSNAYRHFRGGLGLGLGFGGSFGLGLGSAGRGSASALGLGSSSGGNSFGLGLANARRDGPPPVPPPPVPNVSALGVGSANAGGGGGYEGAKETGPQASALGIAKAKGGESYRLMGIKGLESGFGHGFGAKNDFEDKEFGIKGSVVGVGGEYGGGHGSGGKLGSGFGGGGGKRKGFGVGFGVGAEYDLETDSFRMRQIPQYDSASAEDLEIEIDQQGGDSSDAFSCRTSKESNGPINRRYPAIPLSGIPLSNLNDVFENNLDNGLMLKGLNRPADQRATAMLRSAKIPGKKSFALAALDRGPLESEKDAEKKTEKDKTDKPSSEIVDPLDVKSSNYLTVDKLPVSKDHPDKSAETDELEADKKELEKLESDLDTKMEDVSEETPKKDPEEQEPVKPQDGSNSGWAISNANQGGNAVAMGLGQNSEKSNGVGVANTNGEGTALGMGIGSNGRLSNGVGIANANGGGNAISFGIANGGSNSNYRDLTSSLSNLFQRSYSH